MNGSIQSQMQVEHIPGEQRFIISKDDKVALLEYSLDEHRRCYFNRTYVPFAMRGQGYAELLVGAGLGWARDQGYEIFANCWYVDKFLSD